MTSKPPKSLGPAVLDRVARGDPAAFDLLYREFARPLVHLAHRLLGDFEQAQEVTQETFLALWRLCRQGRHRQIAKDARPYIFRMAVNRCYDDLRRQGKMPLVSLDEPLPSKGDSRVISLHDVLADPRRCSPRALLDDKRMRGWLEDGLQQLSLHEKTALLLREKEELSYQEIAEVMEASLVQVKSWIHRGRQKLIQGLQTLLSENHERDRLPEGPRNALRLL